MRRFSQGLSKDLSDPESILLMGEPECKKELVLGPFVLPDGVELTVFLGADGREYRRRRYKGNERWVTYPEFVTSPIKAESVVRCADCAGTGWIDYHPCDHCSYPGSIGGSGYVRTDGTAAHVEEAPDYLASALIQTCPQCGYSNVPRGWSAVLAYTCQGCSRVFPVKRHLQ